MMSDNRKVHCKCSNVFKESKTLLKVASQIFYNAISTTSISLRSMGTYIACSQTLYFLLKVRRARVVKIKTGGWGLIPPAQGGRGRGRRKALADYRKGK